MTILSGTTFTGVPDQQGGPAKPITKLNLQAVAKDHGYVYEGLTNKKSDLSGGAPAVAGHTHIEEGNRLYWPLATQWFGPGGRQDNAMAGTSSSQFQDTPHITYASATVEDVACWYFPLFVPPAWAGLPLAVGLEVFSGGGYTDVGVRATLQTWGTPDATVASPQKAYTVATDVSGMRDVPFKRIVDSNARRMSGDPEGDDATLWVSIVTPATSGLHTIRVNIQLGAASTGAHGFGGLSVVPVFYLNNPSPETKPELSASNIAVVGDADGTVVNDYMPADDSLYADDDPMGMPIVVNQINSGYLEELATGLPAKGNATITVPKGHDHSGPAAAPWYGSGIEFCLLAHPLGSISTNAALGGRIRAPYLTNSVVTFQKFARMNFYTPVYAGTQKLYCAALVYYGDPSKTAAFEIKFTTTPAGGGATSVTLTSSINPGGAARYELITDITNVLSHKSGGQTLLEISGRCTLAAGGTNSVLGYCLWFDY